MMRYHALSSLKRHISEKHPLRKRTEKKVPVTEFLNPESDWESTEIPFPVDCQNEPEITFPDCEFAERAAPTLKEIKKIVSLSIRRLTADTGLPCCKWGNYPTRE